MLINKISTCWGNLFLFLFIHPVFSLFVRNGVFLVGLILLWRWYTIKVLLTWRIFWLSSKFGQVSKDHSPIIHRQTTLDCIFCELQRKYFRNQEVWVPAWTQNSLLTCLLKSLNRRRCVHLEHQDTVMLSFIWHTQYKLILAESLIQHTTDVHLCKSSAGPAYMPMSWSYATKRRFFGWFILFCLVPKECAAARMCRITLPKTWLQHNRLRTL